MTTLLTLSEAHAAKLVNLVAATFSSLVDHLIAELLLQLVLLKLSVRKGIHVALGLLAQVVHVGVLVARQELIRGAHGLIRIAAVLLPTSAIISLLLHIELLTFSDHLAGVGIVMVVWQLVGGEHLLRLGLLGDGHGEPAGVRVVRERVLQAAGRDGVRRPRWPLLLLLGRRWSCLLYHFPTLLPHRLRRTERQRQVIIHLLSLLALLLSQLLLLLLLKRLLLLTVHLLIELLDNHLNVPVGSWLPGLALRCLFVERGPATIA